MKKLPEHAKGFRGKARNIPPRDMFMLPYQSRWITDTSIMKLMEKSRRTGISYSTSYELSREHSLEAARYDTWYSSRDETTARLNINDCRAFAKALDKGARYLGETVLPDKERGKIYDLKFSSDTIIHSLASNPDVFAGKGGNVVLDEFALRMDPRGVYAIAAPSIDWGGKLKIVSTHRGSKNYFNELVTEIKQKGNPKKFSLHTVTLQNALDQHLLWKLQCIFPDGDPRLEMDEAAYFDYQRGRCADEESFLQEYMCVPADDATAFLDYDMITACEYAPTDQWEGLTGKLYVGVDVGRVHDLTVIWVMEKIHDTFYTRKVVELKNMRFAEQEERLYEILERPNMVRCCIDNTGLGRQFAERAQEKFGTYRVEPITFTMASKEEMAYPVRAAFEEGRLRIPERKEIRADLRAVKKIQSTGDHVRFSADRGKNGHSDRFWALALALLAGKSLPMEYDYETVGEENQNFSF